MSWEVAKEIFGSAWVKKLWAAFEIQTLVVASLAFQIILAVFGSRRKYRFGVYTRLIVWFSYIMGTYVSIVALGKLTETNNDSIALTSISYGNVPHKVNVTNNELRAIWAPLLLVHIGGPDSITAFAVEDNRLGLRQFFELGVQISVVSLIFIKSWNNSWLSIIGLTLVLSGAIKSLERVWSLRCSTETKAMFGNLSSSKGVELGRVWSFKSSIPELPLLIKAYIRFEHLKPHLQNWIGHPLSINLPSMSTYYYNPNDVFTIAELELSFMYDVLYTRAPINYTGAGFVRRTFCFLCLLVSLVGYAILFRNADVHFLTILVSKKYDKRVDIGITYLLLVGAITLEIYALLTILCSDWSVLYLIKEQRNKFVDAALEVFASRVSRPPRWSNQMEQLNMFHYCLYKEPKRINRIISAVLKKTESESWDKRYKRFCLTTSVELVEDWKKLIVEEIEQVRGQTVWQGFTKRGEWALERYKCLDQFKWSIESDYTNEANQQTSFGKAITIWHIATDVCYLKKKQKEKSSTKMDLSKHLSDYMMYLLAIRPNMLSIGTQNILFEGACGKLDEFFNNIKSNNEEDEINKILRRFLENNHSQETVIHELPRPMKNSKSRGEDVKEFSISDDVIISSWELVPDAKLLSELLIDRDDDWSLVCSVWIEMLFYAASNCPWIHHTEQIRRGGGLITLVWLLLKHETNKFNISMY